MSSPICSQRCNDASVSEGSVKNHLLSSCTSTVDKSTLDYTLPPIHQLNPEVDTAFAHKESITHKKVLLRHPLTHSLSLLPSTDQPDERISNKNQSPWSPSYSELSHSSKANSDSEEERPLQTPANATEILGSGLQSKEEINHAKHTYTCPYNGCGWSFKRYEHLKRHHLVHTKERPFVCEFPNCGKSFSRSDNYSAHFRTHQRRGSTLETHLHSSVVRENENLKYARLIDRRRSLAVGEEVGVSLINPKFQLKHLTVPSPNNVEYSLISPSKVSNIHQLLNGEDTSSNSFRHKRRYSEHTVVALQEVSEEAPAKIPNYGRAERRHSIAVMTSVPNNVSIPSYFPSAYQNPHILPPNVLHHLYPKSHLNLLTNAYPLSHLPSHPYFHTYSAEQSLPFLSTHAHSVVNTPLATIEESPSHYIPTTTTAPRTSSAKNHVCTSSGCNMRFKRLEHLKRHVRVHTLERPFACTYIGCHKTFSRRDNLGQHMRTHERQALKQIQNGSPMVLQTTSRSGSNGLGVEHAGI